jgi:DNA-binding transcriptional ArsR family regulator
LRRRREAAALASAAPLFAALGDETRLAIVIRLSENGPMSITRLTEGTAVTRQGVTKHLRTMEDAGLVRLTKRGRESICELDTARFESARRHLDSISARWDDALGRLAKLIEE